MNGSMMKFFIVGPTEPKPGRQDLSTGVAESQCTARIKMDSGLQ